jgi:hypothetical protein
MEKAMRFFMTFMAGFLAFGGTASPEPPKSVPKPPVQQADSQLRPAAIVLASAEPVRAGTEAAPAPAKRRIAPRVTTCRCGDPQPAAVPDGQ